MLCENVLYYFEKFVLIYKYTLLQLVADYKIWRLYYNIEYVLIVFYDDINLSEYPYFIGVCKF